MHPGETVADRFHVERVLGRAKFRSRDGALVGIALDEERGDRVLLAASLGDRETFANALLKSVRGVGKVKEREPARVVGGRVVVAQELLRLKGRYVVWSELGAGGMGAVYSAWDEQLGAPVALKVANVESDADKRRFSREARVAHVLGRKAGFVRALDRDELTDEYHFLVMDVVEGATDLDLETGSMEARLRRLATAARLVGVAHAAKIVHRDLKPANLLQAPDGSIWVSDFGLAKVLDEDVSIAGEVTARGEQSGTPVYMAPEHIEDMSGVDARADVFALGVMLFRMLTGTFPWKGHTAIAVRRAQDGGVPKVRELAASVDPELAALCEKAIALDRDDRVATADALAEGLEDWLARKQQPSEAVPYVATQREGTGRTPAVKPLAFVELDPEPGIKHVLRNPTLTVRGQLSDPAGGPIVVSVPKRPPVEKVVDASGRFAITVGLALDTRKVQVKAGKGARTVSADLDVCVDTVPPEVAIDPLPAVEGGYLEVRARVEDENPKSARFLVLVGGAPVGDPIEAGIDADGTTLATLEIPQGAQDVVIRVEAEDLAGRTGSADARVPTEARREMRVEEEDEPEDDEPEEEPENVFRDLLHQLDAASTVGAKLNVIDNFVTNRSFPERDQAIALRRELAALRDVLAAIDRASPPDKARLRDEFLRATKLEAKHLGPLHAAVPSSSSSKTGSLVVGTNVSFAEIELAAQIATDEDDDVPSTKASTGSGNSTRFDAVLPGTYFVFVKKEGYRTSSRTVAIDAGREAVVRVDLEAEELGTGTGGFGAAPAERTSLIVETNVVGARISIASPGFTGFAAVAAPGHVRPTGEVKDVPGATARFANVEPGKLSISVSAPRHRDADIVVDARGIDQRVWVPLTEVPKGASPMRIGEILVGMGYATEEQVARALRLQQATSPRLRLGEILVQREKVCDQEQIAKALAHQAGLKYCQPSKFRIPPEVIALVPRETAIEFGFLPLKDSKRVLIGARAEALDVGRVDDLRFILGKEIEVVIASEVELEKAFAEYYPEVEEAHEPRATRPPRPPGKDTEKPDAPPLEKLVNTLIRDGHVSGARTVEISCGADVVVAYRVGEASREVTRMSRMLGPNLVNRLLVMAGLDPTKRRLSQRGRIEFGRFSPVGLDVDLTLEWHPTGPESGLCVLSFL